MLSAKAMKEVLQKDIVSILSQDDQIMYTVFGVQEVYVIGREKLVEKCREWIKTGKKNSTENEIRLMVLMSQSTRLVEGDKGYIPAF